MSLNLVDYHIHSSHSSDSDASIIDICRRARKIGIEEIGFSEHIDFDPQDWGYGHFDYERYMSDIDGVCERFGDTLIIKKGVEVDYQHWVEEDIRDWLNDKEFDFVIGSVHYLERQYITDTLVAEKGLQELYDLYFVEVNNSIASELFDIVGHLDLPLRYTYRSRESFDKISYWENMQEALTKIIETDTCLEINTKGLRESCQSTYPSQDVLNAYIDQGGHLISVGSDAHSTSEIGMGIKEVLTSLSGKRFTLFHAK
ncbi:MAG: histidinol-phosphatase HisJ family protein [Candidatus Bathyarchaeota archaeon]|nr:histidinol-phosphatase HisJ family protein [Candidatus Bathyarchaeota archaeon]